MSSKEVNNARKQAHQADAELNLHLEIFGDGLAKERGWKYLLGIDAIRYYLMQKHHWTPAQLRAMSYEDLRFAMTEEIQSSTAPRDAI
ncbi:MULTISPECIES: hypothetical protein [unclassified Xanthomonas]|uniref:hypothetical protein n=1 Tax=unclassified Xanthomonas TaxID=2643310 RepID=UPI002A809B11|nr:MULTISPECIES: hypothetical protein [unclassified Xanthomonas]MDY4296812.1 hypothetical protein [Xanthomonas sp. LF02-5]MDY4358429.1 hypothetical protein [Xanthomonas sp. LF04-12]